MFGKTQKETIMTLFEKSEVECNSWLLWTRFSRCWKLR